ncbi:regulatory protein [Ruminococcaceae bacterium FB2012]|nr:regulatory protein [Ruminococcaceae bacterium FB2012]
MYRITNISQYKGRTLRIDFEQGEPAFINAEVVSDLRLAKGMTLTEEQWAKAVYANDLRRARERALYLLDYKDYSYILMFKKLSENYPEQICYEVCDRLAELGVINDRRFAEGLARKYMEVKGFGRYRAVQEMRMKGLSKELIEDALAPYSDTESTRERLRELIEKKYRRRLDSEDGVKKVKNALVRQGYSYADINAVLGGFSEEEE